MNKKVLAVCLVLLLLIGAALAYAFLRPDTMTGAEKDMRDKTAAQTQANGGQGQPGPSPSGAPTGDGAQAGSGQPPAPAPGVYTAYSESAIAQTAGRKLLFFYAPWCPQCRALEASIKEQGVPDGVTIFKVDYDSATALRQKYGVTIQTTIVEVDSDGREIKKYVAYDQPNLPAVLKGLE